MTRFRPVWLTALIISLLVLLTIFFWQLPNLKDESGGYNFGKWQESNQVEQKEEVVVKEEILAEVPEKTLKILFFGDMMLDRHVAERLEGKEIDYLLEGFAGEDKFFFNGWDLIGANLEGAVTDNGEHYAPHNSYDFAFSPERISQLKKYGFNYFTLANNHFSDQGQTGVDQTRKNLSDLGFMFSGAIDAHIDEYSNKRWETNGKSVSLIGLSMVYNHFDLESAKQMVIKSASSSDLVIVNIHWGNEYEHEFNNYQQNIGRALIEAGADIIVGHHPHVVQGLEIYQGKPIFYSLGNFIFDQYFSSATQEGLALGLEIGKSTTSIQFFPFKSKLSAPILMSPTEKIDFWKRYLSWSEADDLLDVDPENLYLELGR